ncbi:U3 small nucleolar interacting protein 2 [Naegleria gruberi]|uniref:U3 small nucleolar interacting protein 2 n=1 Tax=Naegleria gruberi TaxID=5762 RepID=D2VE22_NAEGR|nr:U3 small nucleolar interacting protein 2 [Naegleria gruberi]EFC45002.1 U3 small nucleolar interacting protein 2 [Naegleria gruberi]|eukprot:XP_002677746.1 U3 small nucleolar interacting protein 2 [Naegleria gruberi strain NEG-M]
MKRDKKFANIKNKIQNLKKRKTTPNEKKRQVQYNEDDDIIHSSEEEFEVSAEQLAKTADDDDEKVIRDASEVVEQKEEEEKLTAAEKRVLNAKQFLDNLKQYEEDKEDQDEYNQMLNEQDPIAQALKREALKAKKQIPSSYHKYLEELDFKDEGVVTFLKGHKKPPTCISLDNTNSQQLKGFSVGKDGCIINWDFNKGSKISITKKAHDNLEILSCALSFDGNILATGGKDCKIRLWDTKTMKQIDVLDGHFKPVTSLAFQMGHLSNITGSSNNSSYAYQLYSGSMDRTVKVWDAKECSFVDTLYGHESEVQGIDTMITPHALSCGSDATLRYWKVEDETQLIYKSSTTKYSIDCMKMLRENCFLSGSQDGSLSLWLKTKKKPISHFPSAHGGEWITSVGALRFSDIAASGSSDGYMKLWRCDPNTKVLQLKNNIPMAGFINSIEFNSNGQFLAAAIGQEHRLGRWSRRPQAKNGIAIVKLLSEETIEKAKLDPSNNYVKHSDRDNEYDDFAGDEEEEDDSGNFFL